MNQGLHKQERIGDYELLFPIKSGGMGDVWLARKSGVGDIFRYIR